MENQNNIDKLVELANELKRQKDTKKDYIVPSELIQSEYDVGTNTIKLSIPVPSPMGEQYQRSFPITDFCHSQIGTKTGIPYKFYQRLKEEHPELLVRNINELIREKEKRLVRTLDTRGDGIVRARALLSDRYRIIDNYDVLFSAMDRFKYLNSTKDSQIEIKRADLTESHLYIKAISKKLTDTIYPNPEKQVGDAVEGGVIISNSEVGAGAYKVIPYINILKCQNGLVSEEAFARIHLGKARGVGLINWSDNTLKLQDEALWAKISDIIDQTFSQEIFHAWVDRINHVASNVIEKPIIAVNNIVKQYELSKNKVEELLAQFAQEGYNQWGLSNAVTRIAQKEENYDKQVELEKIGAKILEKRIVELTSS